MKANKIVVFKQYAHKVVITNYPDMSAVKPSPQQKDQRQKFKKAVAYAQNILQNETLKKAYQKKIKNNQTVYHFAIREYFMLHP
jgi:hypothetical protein